MISRRRLLALTSLVALLIVIGVGLAHAQAIDDWFRLHGYSPPTAISKIASQDTMTPKATHILYVTHPVLDSSAADFQQHCPQNEQTIVLGCYHSGITAFTSDSFLYVKVVDDPRLNGVEQVTTAHEMLHAAYDRLSGKQRDQIDQMLQDFYKNGLQDQRIINTINSYKQTEPNDVVNEMHSVFGTEVANLPAPLENYYKQYFSDRGKVVSFAQNYEDEFSGRVAKIKADDNELARERADILAMENDLQSQLSSIEADRNQVERSNDSATIDQYNSRVTAYNGGVRQLRAKIASYNQLVDERNQLALELRSLQNSLSSQLSPQ